MKTFIKKILKNILNNSNSYKGIISFSQSGEDVIMNRYFEFIGIQSPTYLDIGANDPEKFSNTYFFYKKGSSGVCVEPNPALVGKFSKLRPRDRVLNVGVGISQEKEADFYIMDWHEFSTLSKERAYKVQTFYNGRNNIKEIVKIPLITINEIINNWFSKVPDILNLDVEGIDFEIIQKLDFEKYRPTIICIESVEITENDKKQIQLLEFFNSKNYILFADTSINYIFINNQI